MPDLLKVEACNYVRPGKDLQTQAAQSFNIGEKTALVTSSLTFSCGMLTAFCNVYVAVRNIMHISLQFVIVYLGLLFL